MKPPYQSGRQPYTNGVSKPPLQSRTNTFESTRSAKSHEEDSGHLVPNRVGALQRKGSDISAAGSDADSLLEYYRVQPETKTITRKASKSAVGGERRKTSIGAAGDMERDDYWIHRDKLAQIERIELEAAGYRVGRASRSGSRATSTTRPTRERSDSEQRREGQTNGDERPTQADKKQRTVSPIPAGEEDAEDDGPMTWDIRTPEEIAAEQEKENLTPRHALRTSNSRIPIAKTSPAPVPLNLAERDAPLPRSRKGSEAWSGDAIAVNGARARSGSVGSQVMLNDGDDADRGEIPRTPVHAVHSSSSTQDSPPKARVPGKANPGGRKTSTVRTASQKPRVASAASPQKRPGTSSGVPRPSTGHRPEGEAPWLATMYKPDPRLPPDQQIIPTHAKRMQREQWETEGKVGSVYDREFRMLDTNEFNKPERDSKDLHPFERKEDDNEQWPLPSPTKLDRPGTRNGGEGNYTLTPRVQSPQLPSQRNSATRTSVTRTVTSPKPTNPIRVQEPAEDPKAKKGCGCCIVM